VSDKFDFNGLAILVAAASTGIVVVLTGLANVVLQIMAYNRLGHVKVALDGQSEKLNEAVRGRAMAEGTAEGIAQERADHHE
jgi:hypothetical protein